MLLSAFVVLFASGLAVYGSLSLNFYLGPTLVLFAWAFLVYSLSRLTRFPQVIILVVVILLATPVFKICNNWKRAIDVEKAAYARAYMDLVSKGLKKYYDQTKSFPVSESFQDVIWILSELDLVSFKSVKYTSESGKLKTERIKKPTIKDPWGAHYIYTGEKDGAYLTSSGPDLLINTPDDVVKLVKPN